MRYLVTGADGFIGARIHERLSKFFSVIGWDKTFHHRQHLFSRAPAARYLSDASRTMFRLSMHPQRLCTAMVEKAFMKRHL